MNELVNIRAEAARLAADLAPKLEGLSERIQEIDALLGGSARLSGALLQLAACGFDAFLA